MGSDSPNRIKKMAGSSSQDWGGPSEDWNCCSSVFYNASTLLINGNMWLDTNKVKMHPTGGANLQKN